MTPATTAMPMTIGPSEPFCTPVAVRWMWRPKALRSATCHVPTAPTISSAPASPAPASSYPAGRDEPEEDAVLQAGVEDVARAHAAAAVVRLGHDAEQDQQDREPAEDGHRHARGHRQRGRALAHRQHGHPDRRDDRHE